MLKLCVFDVCHPALIKYYCRCEGELVGHYSKWCRQIIKYSKRDNYFEWGRKLLHTQTGILVSFRLRVLYDWCAISINVYVARRLLKHSFFAELSMCWNLNHEKFHRFYVYCNCWALKLRSWEYRLIHSSIIFTTPVEKLRIQACTQQWYKLLRSWEYRPVHSSDTSYWEVNSSSQHTAVIQNVEKLIVVANTQQWYKLLRS